MRKTTKSYLDLTEAERLEHNRKIMELRRNGLWEQIHGIVLPKEEENTPMWNPNTEND